MDLKFESYKSQAILKFVVISIAIAIGFFTLQVIQQNNVKMSIVFIIIPIALFYLGAVFVNPVINMITLFYVNYFVLGITRYVPAPLGLLIDSLLVLTLFALWIKNFKYSVPWERAKNDLTLAAAIWFGLTFIQLVNPEAQSRVAWFYAMRGVALHMFLAIPLTMILLNKHSYIRHILLLWGIFSILAAIKGIVQLHIGLDAAEQRWLAAGAAETHILFGRLRVFSFMSDAGTYGATMGQSTIAFGILAFNHKKNRAVRIFYGLVFLMSFYGMLISGTRGALGVPLGGLVLYILLKKNIKTIIYGGTVGALLFGFLRFTTIGNGNYQINRMRTAVNPTEDASMQARLINQRKLKGYMKSRPFGGGVGSSGNWGLRFTPHTFLANTPTDSWYVMIWVEQGLIGLLAHIGIWLYIIGKGSYILMFKPNIDYEVKYKLQALLAATFGILLASYVNSYLGQMPIGLLCYFSVAFVFIADKIELD